MSKRLELKDLSVGQTVRVFSSSPQVKYYNARVLATDVDSSQPIVLAIQTDDGEDIETADAGGFIYNTDYICELPEYYEVFINIWRLPDGTLHGSIFSTEQLAKQDTRTHLSTTTFIKTLHIKEEI